MLMIKFFQKAIHMAIMYLNYLSLANINNIKTK